jgi:peptidyl-tRNA hydrolase ICT1
MLISSQRVNSKATLRVPLDALLQHVPTALHRDVAASRYLAARANALVVHADDSRKQADNAHTCYTRLYQAIARAAHLAIPADASPKQVQRVKNLYVLC